MVRYTVAAALVLGACSPDQRPAPDAQPAPASVSPTTLAELATYRDWTNGDPVKHAVAFDADARRILAPMSRTQTIDAFGSARYECQYGEASAEYPDPMQVCKREFATRECQMTWEISTTADEGMTTEVLTDFNRDCVGTDKDWPHAVESEIDTQQAPPRLPAPPN
jgi:hypothetical protein